MPAVPAAPPPFAFIMELGTWQAFNKILLGAEVDTSAFWCVVFGTPEPPVSPGKRKLPDFRAAGKPARKPARKPKTKAPADAAAVIELSSDGEYVPAPKRRQEVHARSRAQPRRDCARRVVIDLDNSGDEMEKVVAYDPYTGLNDDAPEEIFIRGVNSKGKICPCLWCGEVEDGCDDCMAFRHWIKSVCTIKCCMCPEVDIQGCCFQCDDEKRQAYKQWIVEDSE